MGRYGMAGDHYRQSGYVTLQDVPDPNREYVETFQNLTGGMNRFDLDYRLKGNESPFLQNMSWHNGTLTSRLGQVEKRVIDAIGDEDSVISCSQFLFHGWLLIQTTVGFYAYKVQQTGEAQVEKEVGQLWSFGHASESIGIGVGTFLRYREDVYFKAKGIYMRITWSYSYDQIYRFLIASVNGTNDHRGAYIPVIQIDSDPVSGAGNQYQPLNRLSDYCRVIYNITAADTVTFKTPITGFTNVYAYIGDNIDDGVSYEIESANPTTGVVVLETAPPVDSALTLEFYYPNPDAKGSLVDSSTAIVFGGAQELCVVMGGPEAQPNSYYWSGNNGIVMDPTYFPMNQYNFAGDNNDPITAFGKQQNMLVIFQPHATGRAVFGTETLDGLVQVTMNYTRINAEIGCDLPGSLQLVENNLVWCNRRYGVCRLKDSSAAYENNIVQISRKINGDYRIEGLLEELKEVADDAVRSVDTGKRYILVLGNQDGKAYEWNYELSEYTDPSWFFHTNILGVGFVPLANEELYEVTTDGKVCTFEMVFSDFGTEPINKIYKFPPRDFGSYDRLKNIKSILVTTRTDAPTNTQLKYTVDYRERIDQTNLVVVPGELNFAEPFRRKPGYHNIHHLGIELSNNTAGDDLNLISAQIFYEYRGRTR